MLDRYTILRPFECNLRSAINPAHIAEAKAGLIPGTIDLIASGGYRIVKETSLGRFAGPEPFPDVRPGDIVISHESGTLHLTGPDGLTPIADEIAVAVGLVDQRLTPDRTHEVVFTSRAISQLAGILVEETGDSPDGILRRLRAGQTFDLTSTALHRIVIQAIEAASSINHLIEIGHREAWMSLRLNDVLTTLTLR